MELEMDMGMAGIDDDGLGAIGATFSPKNVNTTLLAALVADEVFGTGEVIKKQLSRIEALNTGDELEDQKRRAIVEFVGGAVLLMFDNVIVQAAGASLVKLSVREGIQYYNASKNSEAVSGVGYISNNLNNLSYEDLGIGVAYSNAGTESHPVPVPADEEII